MDKYELGEKKFNITRGGSQKKNYRGGKTKFVYITRGKDPITQKKI
jgi:hypothetical protein